MIADRPKSLGKTLGVGFPRADVRPTLQLNHTSRRPSTSNRSADPFLEIAVDVHDLVGSLARLISSYARLLQAVNSGGGNFPPGLGMLWAIIQRRQTFCESNTVALPKLKHDQRRADLFAGQQFEVRQLLTRANVQTAFFVAGELLPPIARASPPP